MTETRTEYGTQTIKAGEEEARIIEALAKRTEVHWQQSILHRLQIEWAKKHGKNPVYVYEITVYDLGVFGKFARQEEVFEFINDIDPFGSGFEDYENFYPMEPNGETVLHIQGDGDEAVLIREDVAVQMLLDAKKIELGDILGLIR